MVSPKSGHPGPSRAVMLNCQLKGRMRLGESKVLAMLGLGREKAVLAKTARVMRRGDMLDARRDPRDGRTVWVIDEDTRADIGSLSRG